MRVPGGSSVREGLGLGELRWGALKSEHRAVKMWVKPNGASVVGGTEAGTPADAPSSLQTFGRISRPSHRIQWPQWVSQWFWSVGRPGASQSPQSPGGRMANP